MESRESAMIIRAHAAEVVEASMTHVRVDLDEALLAAAADVLETETNEATVESALREVVAMRRRVEAMERLRKTVADGAIDIEYLSDKRHYRPRPKLDGFSHHSSEGSTAE
jgi:Arc/MetJ family transcription regulator